MMTPFVLAKEAEIGKRENEEGYKEREKGRIRVCSWVLQYVYGTTTTMYGSSSTVSQTDSTVFEYVILYWPTKANKLYTQP